MSIEQYHITSCIQRVLSSSSYDVKIIVIHVISAKVGQVMQIYVCDIYCAKIGQQLQNNITF